MTNEQGVTQAEQTAPSSPDQNNQPSQSPESGVKPTEGVTILADGTPVSAYKVPYARFQEVKDELNLYKELLQTPKKPKFEPPQPAVPQYQPQPSYETSEMEAWKKVQQMVESETLQRKQELEHENRRALELQVTMQRYKDFSQYADKIKQKIAENPTMDWSDAYKAAKFDDIVSQTREQTRQEVIQKIESKELQVGERSTAKVPGRESQDLISIIKDKTIPLSEIEKLLPHA